MLLRRYKVAEMKQVEVKPLGDLGNFDEPVTKKDSKSGKKKAEK